MTNKKTFKFQLSTLVIIALIAMLSVACKNKVTAAANLSTEAGTEEIINGAEKEEVVGGDIVYNNKDFKATIKNSQIAIEYKDAFGGQGSLVIKAEGKSEIKAKNSSKGFNLLIDGKPFLATDATPNYDANGNLSAIVFSGYGQTEAVNFAK